MTNSKAKADSKIFREAMSSLELKHCTNKKVIETETVSDLAVELRYSSTELICCFKPGIQQKKVQDIKNGKYNCQKTIDLHGCKQKEAIHVLSNFLKVCLEKNITMVLVVHGKSINTNNEKPIIKNTTVALLNHYSSVLGYCSALPKDGGSGALYVLLKSTRGNHVK